MSGDLTPGWTPRLNPTALPEAERRIAEQIEFHLFYLASYAPRFRDALSVYDAGGSGLFVAGRDGAMTIWHIGDAMEKLRKSIDRRICPTLANMIDFDATREADRKLRTLFPGFVDLRDSVAHCGEFSGELDKHATTEPFHSKRGGFAVGIGGTINESFDERQFMNSSKGRVRSCELSRASLDGIKDVIATFFSAFKRAEDELNRLAAEGPSDPIAPA